ncbi:MAG: nitroreductase family protein [Candidatus Aenigmarchaeota archaeon]|nr:nitroreductase family protein [Candidatus Aenigmarchaeota archaeon]
MVFRYFAGTKRRNRAGKALKDVKASDLFSTRSNTFNTVREVIESRRAVRKYIAKDVPDSVVYKLLEAAAHAPSEGNQQPWEFIVVRDHIKKEHIVEACYNQNWMLQAPVFIVACTNMRLARAIYGERGERLYGIQATAAAIQNLLLSAQSMGLSTCWIGSFSESKVAILTGCPDYIRPAGIITLGFGAENPEPPMLQKAEDYIHIEEFGRTLLIESVIDQKSPLGKGRSEVDYWAKS